MKIFEIYSCNEQTQEWVKWTYAAKSREVIDAKTASFSSPRIDFIYETGPNISYDLGEFLRKAEDWYFMMSQHLTEEQYYAVIKALKPPELTQPIPNRRLELNL